MAEDNQIQPAYSDLDTDLGRSEPAALGIDYVYYLASPFFAGFKTFTSNDWRIFLASFYELSPNIKSFITDPETSQAIFKIGTNNGLEDNQIYKTSELIREFLLGKIFIKDLPSQLAQRINIEEVKSAQIVNQIVSQLFGPIIEDIKRIQRSKFPDKIQQLQKESRPSELTLPGSGEARSRGAAQPAGITQPTARPLPPRPNATEVGPPKEDRPRQEVQPQRPWDRLQGAQSVRPLMPPPQVPLKPNPEVGPRGEVQPQQPSPPKPSLPRPQFKVPDLSGMTTPAQTPSSKAGESLEKELEKVAGIIDLRNKPKE